MPRRYRKRTVRKRRATYGRMRRSGFKGYGAYRRIGSKRSYRRGRRSGHLPFIYTDDEPKGAVLYNAVQNATANVADTTVTSGGQPKEWISNEDPRARRKHEASGDDNYVTGEPGVSNDPYLTTAPWIPVYVKNALGFQYENYETTKLGLGIMGGLAALAIGSEVVLPAAGRALADWVLGSAKRYGAAQTFLRRAHRAGRLGDYGTTGTFTTRIVPKVEQTVFTTGGRVYAPSLSRTAGQIRTNLGGAASRIRPRAYQWRGPPQRVPTASNPNPMLEWRGPPQRVPNAPYRRWEDPEFIAANLPFDI
jgi:hypothetical protein